MTRKNTIADKNLHTMTLSGEKITVCPDIDENLILYLKSVFRLRASSEMGLREYDIQFGQMTVIHHLEAILKAQQDS